MLSSLTVTSFALEKPTIDTGGMSIFVDDVRVEKKDTTNPVDVKVTVTAGSDYTKARAGTVVFDIDAASTGISETSQLTGKAEPSDIGGVNVAPKLGKTGKGNFNFSSGQKKEIGFVLTLPNVTATTKINASAKNMFGENDQNKNGIGIEDSKIKIVSGSVIVQYPVTVKVEGDVPTGAAATVNTKIYNGKATFDSKSMDSTNVLEDTVNGTKFWVDSGAGQQKTPVLNITAPTGYYAQVKTGGGNYTNAAGSFSLGEITAATEATVTFKEGSAPVEETTEISVTDSTAEGWTLSKWTTSLAKKGTVNIVSPKTYEGYTVRGYKINGGEEETIAADGTVQVDLTADRTEIEFLYERSGNTVVVPGPDGEIVAPKDTDNVTVKPNDASKTPTIDPATKDVTVPVGGGSVIGGDGSIIEVPEGTVVTPDGNVKLPGTDTTIKPGKTDSLPDGFYKVTYVSTEGTGKLPVQIVENGKTAKALALPDSFQPLSNREFTGWNERENGSGNAYEAGVTDVTGTLTLYAQWKNKGADFGENKITITYQSNNGKNETATQVLGAKLDTTFTGTLTPDKTFVLDGWTLAGWNAKADGNGTVYRLNGQITRTKAEGDLPLFAQWIKEGENSITVPGSDNTPGTDKDATANGSKDEKPSRNPDTGIIKVPVGGNVTTDNGKTEYPMPGGGTLKPDGTITIKDPDTNKDIVIQPGKDPVVSPTDPDANTKKVIVITYASGVENIASVVKTAIVDKDGGKVSVVSGDTLFPRDGYKFAYWKNDDDEVIALGDKLAESTTLTANWYKVGNNGEIIVPKDPNGEVVVKPDPTDPDNPDKKPGVDKDGNVEVKPGGEVETKPDGGTITLPDGGKVTPDGEIKVPNGNGGETTINPNNPASWPAGYYAVVYEKNGTNATGTMAKQIGKDLVALANGFKNGDLAFLAWNAESNGSGTGYKPGVKIPAPGAEVKDKTITLYAMWGKTGADGSITVPGKDGSVDPDSGKDNVTVKPGPDGKQPEVDDNGNVKVPGGGTVKKEPDGSEITPPGGSVVTPNGNIVVTPDPNKPGETETIDPSDPNSWPEGWFTVEYLPNDTNATGSMGQQLVKDKATALSNAFKNTGKEFVAWNIETDGSGTAYKAGIDKITKPADRKTVTLHAIWSIVTTDPTDPSIDGSITVPGPNGKVGDDDDVTIRPNGNGQKPAWRDDKSGVNVPDGGKVEYPGNKVIVPPNGSWVKPDGTVVLPDNKTIEPANPSAPIEGYVTITFMPNTNGTGIMPVQYVKTSEQATLLANGFSGGAGKTFGSWNTDANGHGIKYTNEQIIPADTLTNDLVLWAQWIDESAANQATVIFNANDGTDTPATKTQIIGSADTTIRGNLEANTFALKDWTFNGWNTKPNGSGDRYTNGQLVTLTKDGTLPLYAQWIKESADGSITVPGKDNKPGTPDDVTVKPNPAPAPGENGKPGKNEDGSIDVPKGGSVETPKGEIKLPDGGTVKPDGTVIIPDPSKPGGTTEVDPANPDNPPAGTYLVTYHPGAATGSKPKFVYVKNGTDHIVAANSFSYDDHVFAYWTGANNAKVKVDDTVSDTAVLTARWLEQKKDGTIVIPDPKNEPNGTIEVKPNPNPGQGEDGKPKVDKDGNIDVPKGGEVEKKPDGGSVILPDGGKVTVPDGDIKVPNGSGGQTTVDPENPNDLPEGWFTVEYRANDNAATGTMPKQVSKTVLKALDNRFALDGHEFVEWNTNANGSGTVYAKNADIQPPADGSKTVILHAQWRKNGGQNPTVSTATITFYKDADKTETVTQTETSDGTQMSRKLKANTFTLTDWIFMGWNTKADGTGTFYANETSVELKNGDALELYATWYKQNGDNVVIPGPDGKPGTPDDITIKPADGGTEKPTPDDKGNIKVPDSGKIEIPGKDTPNDDKTITVTPGATVTPDGTITLPEGGSAIIKPDGTKVNGPAVIKPDGSVENPDKDKPFRPGNGTITVPGKDGKTGTPDDVKVTPDKGTNGKDNSTIDTGTGNVTLPDGGKVKYPDDPDGNGTTVTVPGGTVIKPDGSIVLPDGKDATVEPGGGKIPGGSEIGPDGEVKTYAYTVKFAGTTRADEVVKIAKGVKYPVTAPAINGYTVDKTTVEVTGGEQVNGGYVITFTYTQNSGGTIIVTPSNPSKPSNPNKPSDPSDTNRPASPSVTGVSKMLESENHIAYMGGYGNGMFGPNDQMTRAQVAQMFYNLLKDKNIAITVNFSDVQGSDWYATAVNTLASLGIIRGVGDGIFDPNRSITRAEFATIALRFADKTADGTNPFTDVASNDWYYSAVLNAVGFGWITGYSDGTFRPNASITRAEVATIVNRMLDRNADHDFVNGNATASFVDVPSNHWAYYNIMEATTPHTHTVDRNGNESWGKLQ